MDVSYHKHLRIAGEKIFFRTIVAAYHRVQMLFKKLIKSSGDNSIWRKTSLINDRPITLPL